jgi:hypothetical protein
MEKFHRQCIFVLVTPWLLVLCDCNQRASSGVRPCSWYTHVHCENVVTSLSNQGIVSHSASFEDSCSPCSPSRYISLLYIILSRQHQWTLRTPEEGDCVESSSHLEGIGSEGNLAGTQFKRCDRMNQWYRLIGRFPRRPQQQVDLLKLVISHSRQNGLPAVRRQGDPWNWQGGLAPNCDNSLVLLYWLLTLLIISAPWIAKPQNWRMSRLNIDVNFRRCLCYQQLARHYSGSSIYFDPLLYWPCVFCWKGGRPPLQAHPLSDQWS